VKKLISIGSPVKSARVAVLGFTFKENCPDTRNTKVIDIINELKEYGIEPLVCDPVADSQEAEALYGVSLIPKELVGTVDAVIIAVAHSEFANLSVEDLDKYFSIDAKKVVIDIKSILNRNQFEQAGYCYWSL
jgi:UDP-N-acetyl-D-galactosamine dehydrogenase